MVIIATEPLIAEHGKVMLMLAVLEKINQKLAAGEKVDPPDLERIGEFLSVFVDQCHHGKEERVLFPTLNADPDFSDRGLVEELLAEHQKGRELVKQFKDGSGRYAAGGLMETETIRAITDYIHLIRQHVGKENGRLFPEAGQKLDVGIQESLSRDYEKIEEEEIGIGRCEQFRKLLEELRVKYLGKSQGIA